ncbi:NUDIX domain-containing protein [Pseudomonadota bacterium]
MEKDNPISAGVAVVRRIDGEWHFLLLRAYQHWDFPKGLVEDGEESLQAALREVEEESTLVGLVFHWGYGFYETAPYGKHRKIARYYIAESSSGDVDLPINPELGHPEHEEFCWVTRKRAYELVSPRVHLVLDWITRTMKLDG